MSKIKLSGRDQDILTTLYRFRGMTALQLAQIVHNSREPKNSQKSMIHNYLKRLKKQKVITSKKLEDEISLGSIYYLTPKGFQLAKDVLNIEIGQVGEGFKFADEIEGFHTHADLEYSIYKPPLEQISHHLLLIDSLIKLEFLYSEEQIDYRLSMYATREYKYKEIQGKLRPDGELHLSDGRKYFIEIDKGTESYQQLYEKFINYRNYLSQLDINKFPAGILFITDAKRQIYGLKRRWTTILAAYMNAMGKLAVRVNLVLSPLNKLEETVLFEIKRLKYNQIAAKSLKDYLASQGNHSYRITLSGIDHSLWYAIVTNGNRQQLVFSRVVNEYESGPYSYFIYLIQNIKSITKTKNISTLIPLGFEQSILFYKSHLPFLPLRFPEDKWSKKQQTAIELFHDKLTWLSL